MEASRHTGELDRTKNEAMFAALRGTSWSELIDSVKKVKEKDPRGLVKDAVGGDKALKTQELNSQIIISA
ncbi:hypothetical protein ACOME3_008780 [Neoechinorhynchus agilis]